MIRIVDYRAGNAPSVMNAVTHLGFAARMARQPADLADATHVILPGVGSAGATLASLRESGMTRALNAAVRGRGALFLGICVGMQVLFEHSEEEDTNCLGWLKGDVVRFRGAEVRVPQMGWNEVRFQQSALEARDDYFYFVNSYHARPADPADVWGVSEYGGEFASAVHRGNLFATQFHIEKSGEAGLALLRGFLRAGRAEAC